jgi:hypothetical protein
MSNQYPNAGTGMVAFTNSGAPDYYDRLRNVKVFEEQAMYNSTSQTIEINDTPERVRGMNATPSLFHLLRAAPVIKNPRSMRGTVACYPKPPWLNRKFLLCRKPEVSTLR